MSSAPSSSGRAGAGGGGGGRRTGSRSRKTSLTSSNMKMFEEDSSDEILQTLATMQTGRIVKLCPMAKYGFINSTGKDSKNYVHFKFGAVVNASGKTIYYNTLAVNTLVHFELGEWNGEVKNQTAMRVIISPATDVKSSRSNTQCNKANSSGPMAKAALPPKEGKTEEKISSSRRPRNTWLVGTVCNFKNDQPHVFLKVPGQPKDIFLHRDKLSRFALELKAGDQIEFVVAEKSKLSGKPSALKARFHSFKERPNHELTRYLEELNTDVLSSPNGELAALELVPIKCLWNRLSFGGDSNYEPSFGRLLICVILQLLKKCKRQAPIAIPMIEAILDSRVFLELLLHEREHESNLWNFLKEAVTLLPQIAMKIFPRVEQICRAPSAINQQQLLEFTKSSCLRLNNLVGGGIDTKNWRILGSILTEMEIMAATPCSEDENLHKIKIDEGYSSTELYLETYYRLFRAETLTPIQEAIKNYLRGPGLSQKSQQKTNNSFVYDNLKLVGFEIDRTLSVILQFNTVKGKVKDWTKSRRLMFGNLLCLSPGQKFSEGDIIWATVSNRDEDLLKRSCIAVEFFNEFNAMSIAAIISLLHSNNGRTIMIESPTYFRPMGCVMETFKDMPIDQFKLVKQIVSVEQSTKGVSYLGHNSKTIADFCRLHNLDIEPQTNTMSEDEDFASEDKDSTSEEEDEIGQDVEIALLETLDKLKTNISQKEAFMHAMTNPLTIIQGPPGCGKTFIGLELSKVILKCQFSAPILILTYKNHALDEFLKGMVDSKACKIEDIVRVGSGSQDPTLEKCNLNKLVREESRGRALDDRYYDLSREVNELTEELKEISEELNSRSILNRASFISQLNTGQLIHIVTKAKWSTRIGDSPCHNINKSTFVTEQWILKTGIPFVNQHFGGIKSFSNKYFAGSTLGEDNKGDATFVGMCEDMGQVILKAANSWLPDRSILEKLQQIREKLCLNRETAQTETERKDEVADDEDELDDEEMEDLFQDRISNRTSKFRGTRIQLKSIEDSEIIFKHNDLPKDAAFADLSLLAEEKLWEIDELDRFKFLHALISNQRDEVFQRFNEVLSDMDTALISLKALETNKKLAAVMRKKVIGMTITGASLYSDLMQKVLPSVVIVEEAAEILETSLFAALNENVEHLILIGDHKQLRPGVETYELVKHYNFDISMMERLIKTGFPYRTLDTQGRMRPEFSSLLKDIYPDLKDNLALVSSNKPLDCMQHSMFFWTHNNPESGKDPDGFDTKSKVNEPEAEMVVALVQFLVRSGVDQKKITVLAAYLRQKNIIRDTLLGLNIHVQVSTIDKYQGDENDYVLVSMVRSNPNGVVGFMGTMNRRCVAQSRAKAGLYFVGNHSTFQKAKLGTWNFLLEKMQEKKMLGPTIGLQCPKHKKSSRQQFQSAEGILQVVNGSQTICKFTCGELSHCQKKEHPCLKPCVPFHDHFHCMKLVNDTFVVCGHSTQRRCFESLDDLQCKFVVAYSRLCGHTGNRKCYNVVIPPCPHPCKCKMGCKIHDCQQKCGSEHSHSSMNCKETVQFMFASCGHEAAKKCCQAEGALKCQAEVTKTHPKCNHPVKKKCSEAFESVICQTSCAKKMILCQHDCPEICGSIHQHDSAVCKVKIDYTFPNCKHPSPRKKLCGEVISWPCSFLVEETRQRCGHKIIRKCHEKRTPCQELCPKGTLRKCGHPSTSRCGEDPDKGSCNGCKTEMKERNKAFQEAAAKRADEIEEAIKNRETQTYWHVELKNFGDSKNEYMTIRDRVMKYIQPMHGWAPEITRIERVYNKKLELKFERAKESMFGDLIDLKFHGTGPEGVEGIPKTGFRLPNEAGMFGKGIYFATDSSKSARTIYTKGSNTLLLCEVLLGRSKTTDQADQTLNGESLKEECFDSVFAPRGSAVQNDEYVVFNPDQALVKYIIQYRSSSACVAITSKPIGAKPTRKIIKPQRIWSDPEDEAHWNAAYIAFHKNSVSNSYEINAIEVVRNPELEANFQKKKIWLKSKGSPDGEIRGFHGTDPQNIDSIIKQNLDPNRAATHGRRHGEGCYFSEFPDFSLGYGQGLLLFRILPGRESTTQNPLQDYDTKKVDANNDGYGQILVIKDSHQFLPIYIYHISKTKKQ